MIKVFNCGHNSRHKKPCNILHPAGLSDYLILFIKSYAWFEPDPRAPLFPAGGFTQRERTEVPPNCVLLFPPSTPIHYGCDAPGYNDDWIHFDLYDNDSEFLSSFSFPYGVILQPRDFHRLSDYVKSISNEFHSNGTCRERIIDHFMHILLYALDEELKKTADSPADTQKYYRRFAQIRTQIYNSPAAGWSVSQIADSLCLSCSHFQHLYRRFFGCSCQQDIILAKIALAKFYLATTDMSIYQLSLFCGYETDLHFMRQFKKHTGATPSQYRAQTRHDAGL